MREIIQLLILKSQNETFTHANPASRSPYALGWAMLYESMMSTITRCVYFWVQRLTLTSIQFFISRRSLVILSDFVGGKFPYDLHPLGK